MPIRSTIVACALVLAALSAWVPDYGAAVVSRSALRVKRDPFPREYRRFVAELPSKTTRGETVALVLSEPNAPPYFQGVKTLVGRRVIVANAKTGKAMDRLGEADFVAVWPESLGVPAPFREVERFYGGAIGRR